MSFNYRYVDNNNKRDIYRKIKSFQNNDNWCITKTRVRNVNLDCVRPERAGVIILTIVNGVPFIGLGLDAKSHDLTDFGGHIIASDKNVIEGALREFDEETLMIFEPISYKDIGEYPVIYDDKNLIIFIHMKVNPDKVSNAFNTQYQAIMSKKPKKRQRPEVCGIVWLSWEEFQYSINTNGVIFSRVQRFLRRVGDFSYLF